MGIVEDVLAQEARTEAPPGMLEDALARTRAHRQSPRRPWDGLAVPPVVRGGAPAVTVGLVILVVLVAVGSRFLPSSGPSPTPSSAPALATCADGGPLGGTAALLWVGCPGGVRAVDTTIRPIVEGELIEGVGVPVSSAVGTWATTTGGIVAVDPVTGPGRRIDVPDVALLAAGEAVLWAGTTKQSILRIDPVAGAVTGTIEVGAKPLALLETAASLWVAADDGRLHAFSAGTLAPTREPAAVGADPALIAASASAIYVASRAAEGTVSRVDIASGAVASAVVDVAPDRRSRGELLAGEDAVWITRRSEIVRLVPVTLVPGEPEALPGIPVGLVRASEETWVLFEDGRLELVPLPE
jgi:hypothetical protein